MKRIVALATLTLCALAPAPRAEELAAGATVPVFLHRVQIQDASQVGLLSRLGFDIAGVSRKDGTVDVLGDLGTIGALRDLGFDARRERDLTPTPESTRALSDYLEPSEINARLDQYVASHPSLARKVQYATTGEGRPVYALKISDNVAVEEDEPAIFFIAQHHAREVMTPEIALDIAGVMLDGYGVDPKVTSWADGREIWVLPNHNPDGTYFVFHSDSFWRKNRRNNGNGTFGVDQNRNYPFKWAACSGSSGDGGSDTYRGPSAGSEPETTGGITVLARDQRPVIALSYHTYSELVIMPYGCTGSYSSENATFRNLASGMATSLRSDDGQFWYQPGTAPELLYAVDGEMNDWFYGELGTYSVTVEANSSTQGFQPDYATWRQSTVERNRPGWKLLLDRVDGPGIRGHVQDACTGAALQADVSLDQVVFANGETPRTSEPLYGRFQWLTMPGAYTLRVGKGGYTAQAWPVAVGLAVSEREVRLVPAGSFGLAAQGLLVDDSAGDDDGEADPGEQVIVKVRLVNTGGALTGVTASIASSDPAVSIGDAFASYGSIGPGGTSDGDGFTLTIDPGAQDEHEVVLSLSLDADPVLCAPSDEVMLRVTTGVPACPWVEETLDADPGWAISNSGSGGWQFGPPQGNGSSTGPASAHTGMSVYGTNLSGNYGDNGNFLLTTTPYDLRGVRHAELRYWRWLDNEAGFDIATTEVSTDGGATWTEIASGFAYGEGWQLERIDISALADQEDDVRFRFRLRSDGGVTRPGWYVDDLSVCGESVPSAAGKLKYESHSVSDTDPQGGNGNGAVDVGETVTLELRLRSSLNVPATGVRAFLSTSTPGVRVRTAYAEFPDMTAGSTGDSLAPHFTLSVDSAACATRIALTLDVQWDAGSARSTFTVPVGAAQVAVVLDDDFETGSAWTTGSTALAGFWVREDPYRVIDPAGTPVQPEDDVTPSPGVRCWVTANPRPNGNFNPLSGDVDRGTVWLESPVFDGASADRLDLDLSRWFVRRNAGQFDASEYRLLASADGGSTWTTIERLDTDSPFWATRHFDLTDLLAVSSTMKVRVEVKEQIDFGTGDTLVEGLVDDVTVERERLECAPFTPASRQRPNAVGGTLALRRDGLHLRLDWQAPPVDAGHDAAYAYRVYRAPSAAAGYAVVAWPTATFDVDKDEMLDAASGYFLIVAENAGGTSGDEPMP